MSKKDEYEPFSLKLLPQVGQMCYYVGPPLNDSVAQMAKIYVHLLAIDDQVAWINIPKFAGDGGYAEKVFGVKAEYIQVLTVDLELEPR